MNVDKKNKNKLTSDFSTTDYIQLEQNRLIFFYACYICYCEWFTHVYAYLKTLVHFIRNVTDFCYFHSIKTLITLEVCVPQKNVWHWYIY